MEDMIPIASSAFLGVDYNSETRTLTVYIRNGRNYVHHGVPESVYKQFLNSPSKGRYYNQYIKGIYQ